MSNRPPLLLDAPDRFGFSAPTSPSPTAPRRMLLSPGSKVSNLTASLLLAPPGAAVDERGSKRAALALQAQQQRMLDATGGQNAGWIGERVEHFDPLSLAMSRPGAHRLPGFDSLSSGFLRASLNPYAANHSAHLLEEDGLADDGVEGVNLWPAAEAAAAVPAPIFDEKEMIEQVWDYRSADPVESPRTAARTRRKQVDREVVEQSHQRVASLIQAASSASSSAFKFSRASLHAAGSPPAAAGEADVAARSNYALSVDQPPVSAQPLPSAASTQASGPFANMFNVLPLPDGSSSSSSATPSNANAHAHANSPAESQQMQGMTPMSAALAEPATTFSPPALSPLVSPGGVGLPSPNQSDSMRSPSPSVTAAPSTHRSDPSLSASRLGLSLGSGERTAESIFADSHEVDPNYSLLPMSTLRHVVPGYAHLHPRIAVLSPGLGLRSIQKQTAQAAKDAHDTKVKRETGPLPSTDPYYETIVAKRASKLGRALALFQSGAFKQSPRVDEEQPDEDDEATIPILSEAELAAAAAEAMEQKARQEKLAADIELDRLKVIAHEQYMRLVIRHVRTRLIQEQRFICTSTKGSGSAPSSPPQHSGSTSAQQSHPSQSEYEAQVAIRRRDRWGVGGQATAAPTAAGTAAPSAMASRASSATPVRLRDISYEVTGIRTPLPDPDFNAGDPKSPKASGGKGNPRAPSSTGGKKSGAQSMLSPKGITAAAVADVLPPGSFDPLANISFHIDPLDPSRPENVGKIYRMNPAYISQGHTFPLWSRGPTHSWQVLLDEEEVSCYRKVLWMCEIQALSHVPLDGMLELILSMVERAFDVEVILRAGDPGSSLFLIKHGEVQLKMERSIVEQMEESHMLAEQREIEAKALTGAAASLLVNHPHPAVPAVTAADAPIPSAAPLAPGRPAPLSLLTTDPELQTKFVEIAKLGAMGLFGEDILLAPHRRYTVLSLTPVWAYEIKAVDLLKAFDAAARASLCEAVAHTQRVRERHALVKNRTRLQHHAAPTLFRHFLDDGLQRNLRRHATVESRIKAVQRVSLGEMQGSPDALRAVLHDLDHIQSKQRYNRKSPQNIEALVRKGSVSAREAQEVLAAQKKASLKTINGASPQTKSATTLPVIGSPSKSQRSGVKSASSEEAKVSEKHTSVPDEGDEFTGRPPALSITFDSPSASPPALLSPDECDPVSPTSPNGTKIGWRSVKHSLLSPDAPLHQLVRQNSLERIKESKGLAGLALNALEVARTPAGAGWATDAAAASVSGSTPASVSASGSGSVTPSTQPRSRGRAGSRDVSPDPRSGGGGGGSSGAHATLYDPSPFSLQFREGSVLEKSGIGLSAPSRGGAVGLHVSYNKTHVARGNVVPMRAQHGSMVMLGFEADQGLRSFGSQGDEYARPEPMLSGAVHAPSIRKRGASVGDGVSPAGSVKSIKAAAAATAAAAAAAPASKSPPTKLRSSASLPALLQPAAAVSTPAPAASAASLTKSPPVTYALRSSASVKRLAGPLSSSVKHSPSQNKGTLASAVMRK